MLQILLIGLYVVVCLFLIGVVLLQTGKRADLAGAFGGGGSQTAFGPRGAANLFTKLTTVSAVLFMLLALVLSILGSRGGISGGSVLDEVPAPAAATAPATDDDAAPADDLPPLPAADTDGGATDAAGTDPDAP